MAAEEVTSKTPPLFHLAIPVDDLAAAEDFYGGLLGCRIGRRDERWIDFDFFGHQLTAHRAPREAGPAKNPVDGEKVPVRHFGTILDADAFASLCERLTAAEADFLIPPTLRHRGQPGEQRTMFVKDPSGNALEFKSFTNPADVFAAA